MISLLTNSRQWMFIIIVIMLSSACRHHPKQPVQPDYGIAYNHVRDYLGIKSIPLDYVVDESKDSYEGLWLNYTDPNLRFDSMSKLPKAYHGSKRLKIINDTLFFEVDEYVLVRYPTLDKRIPLAILSYTYYYSTNRCDSFMHFGYIINAHPESDTLPYDHLLKERAVEWIIGRTRRDSLGRSLPMTRAEADSILATWGMKYP